MAIIIDNEETTKNIPINIPIFRLGIPFDNILIIAFVLKSKSTVSSYYHKSIFHSVLHTHFIHEKIKIPVNISRNDYGFAFRKFIYVIVCIIHAVCFPNMDEVFPE